MSATETKFWCIVAKVQTMADGGKRVYLDLPESATLQAAEMMAYQAAGVVLDVVMTKRDDERPGQTGNQRKSTSHY